MAYTNARMAQMVEELAPLLRRDDVIGYAAARNTRILRTELTEYYERHDELVLRLGSPRLDGEGNPTGEVYVPAGSPEFTEFTKRITELASIEHDPKVFKVKYEAAIGRLTGEQILAVDFMFED